MQIDRFIQGLPKTELHVHIEGTLEPEMLFALAKKNNVKLPYVNLDELRAAYQFEKLQDFLDLYYQGMAVLLTENDFFDLTWAYLQRAKEDAIVHTEIFFDPQAHTDRGIDISIVINGITSALNKADKELGISSQLIMCFLRHLSERKAIETLQQAKPFLNLIAGVGLDSSERDHPPEKFTQVFAMAKELGLKLVAHAGEEGPASYIRNALNVLHVDRIDHGNACLDDEELVKELAKRQIALTVCPLSNTYLKVVKNMRDHPVPRMLKAGLCITINSDDPAYFGGYLNNNYQALQDHCHLSKESLVQLAKNSVTASFASEKDKSRWLSDIDHWVQNQAV